MGHAGGAPPKLNGHVLGEAEEYVDGPDPTQIAAATKYLQDCVPKFTKRKRVAGIPTIEGLALHLDVSRDTIYRWAKQYPDFARVVRRLELKQADQTIQQGAVGNYTPKVTGVILARHGYIEKSESENTIKFDKDGKADQFLEDA